jgi:hypothetical protein
VLEDLVAVRELLERLGCFPQRIDHLCCCLGRDFSNEVQDLIEVVKSFWRDDDAISIRHGRLPALLILLPKTYKSVVEGYPLTSLELRLGALDGIHGRFIEISAIRIQHQASYSSLKRLLNRREATSANLILHELLQFGL